MKSLIFKIIILIFMIFAACKSNDKQLVDETGKKQEEYTFTGIVQEIIKYPKTLSEYSYFILKPDAGDSNAGQDLILFNKDKLSLGFENYTDRRVEVSGNFSLGYIGWRKTLKQGLLVKEIKIIE